jgi:2-dehydropantoate 2-reductase
MRICIYGAGAVGGYLGAELARSGADVVLIARGAHLTAMRERGLRLRIDGEERVQKVACSDDPREVGPCDHVIATLKAHSLSGALDAMQPLFGPDTSLVTAQNGIPWWYFHRCAGAFEDRRLESVDPGGRISSTRPRSWSNRA